ncbi:MAG: hypothetical protein ACK53Y_25195, partial [bacterium]
YLTVMPYSTACLGKGLLSCELLAIPAAAAAGILLDVQKKHRLRRNHAREGRSRLSVYSFRARTREEATERECTTYWNGRDQVERQARKSPKISFTGYECVSAD